MLQFSLQKTIDSAEGKRTLRFSGSLARGETLALYAPSGHGKTTLLRLFAGLLLPENGKISCDDTVWLDTGARFSLPTAKRPLAFMFQDYALLPHLTVRENLNFAQKIKNSDTVGELLAVAGLQQLADKYPTKLSGGQQQRVALMRCFVNPASVYLLDEPLSALDRKLRLEMLAWLKETLVRIHRYAIVVSHDLAEVFYLADKLARFDQEEIRLEKPEALLPPLVAPGRFRLSGQIIQMARGALNTQVQVAIGQETVMTLVPSLRAQEMHIGQYVDVFVNGSNVVIG